jgi:hypothetical protein
MALVWRDCGKTQKHLLSIGACKYNSRVLLLGTLFSYVIDPRSVISNNKNYFIYKFIKITGSLPWMIIEKCKSESLQISGKLFRKQLNNIKN